MMENGAHFDVAAFETAVAAAAAVAAVTASNSYEFVQNEQVTGSEELREESDNHLRKVSPPNTPDFGPVVGDVHPDVDEPKEVVASDDDEHGSSDSNKGALVEDRVAKNRERNREHARRTRLRKKEQLKRNQQRLKDLEQENRRLKLNVEECKVASILLGMASASKGTSKCSKAEDVLLFEGLYDGSETKAYDISKLVGKRKRFVSNADEYSEHPSKGSKKSQINWKSGVMYNENGEQRHLSASELDSLRRERNRIHAKMTRDRKKMFMANIEQTIVQLEEENKKMRDSLAAHIAAAAISESSIRSLIAETASN